MSSRLTDLGYTKLKIRSHGQPVYKKGKSYITPDIDGHNGGSWKKPQGSPDNLKNWTSRDGTYDRNMRRIGP